MSVPGIANGALVAQVVAGAWRPSPPALGLSLRELAQVTPLLLETGAGGLGWWRIRETASARTREGRLLQQAYRLHTLQAALHEQQLVEAVKRLRQAGIEPLLAKGWAVGRLYPQKGLRPYGDLDLAVPRHQEAQAKAALRVPGAPGLPVDLHAGWPYLDDRPVEQQYERSQVFGLNGYEVRVVGCEDHLRLLCLHMLGEGCWRPLWLCDIAVTLEARPAGFDWDYFLWGNRRRTAWVLCALGLAHRLVGARLEDTPAAEQATRVPEWMVQEALYRLGRGHPPYAGNMLNVLTRRKGVLGAIRRRWRRPIEVGLRWRSPWSKLPMLPFQVWDYGVRVAVLPWRLTQEMKAAR